MSETAKYLAKSEYRKNFTGDLCNTSVIVVTTQKFQIKKLSKSTYKVEVNLECRKKHDMNLPKAMQVLPLSRQIAGRTEV